MTTYEKIDINDKEFIIFEKGHDFKIPFKTITASFDTETITYFKNQIYNQKTLFKKIKNLNEKTKRKYIRNETWSWQVYDELNGFFMTNSFNEFMTYLCRAGIKFCWCYNATFDFAQIDWQLVGENRGKWHLHEKKKEGDKAYMKNQEYTYESLHSDTGVRYAYKIWFPYRSSADRHKYVHSVAFHDFMKLVPGGLKKLLEDLDVQDLEGKKIRKLEMNYQAVNIQNLTNEELSYCENDVKGLYFAIKKFNEEIERQSNNECHIFGKLTNIMTAGGFAKRELLRSLYPNLKKQHRLKKFQRDHPLNAIQDKWIRDNHLYRGGICLVNENFQGKMITSKELGRKMNRYDVNSEYPYSMSIMRDLVGRPIIKNYEEWTKMTKEYKEKYECIIILESVTGELLPGRVATWYDPFKRNYVKFIDENSRHLMFERELLEMTHWYALEFTCEKVMLYKKGDYIYKKFVDDNYQLKKQAKKDKNKTLQQIAKLKLNSSYGKLAERIERRTGIYEINEETNAVHFVETGIEKSESSAMNVIIGSLITSIARCYILSKIRELCSEENIEKSFIYIDTDSIHAFADYDKADAFTLGGLKLEATCEAVKYIAPKTYIDIEKNDKIIDLNNIEIHCKGVSIKVVQEKFKSYKKLSLARINQAFDYGKKYIMLSAMNVPGGKTLLPVEKFLARDELRPNYFLNYGYEGNFENER